jgi:hypothetical protein
MLLAGYAADVVYMLFGSLMGLTILVFVPLMG